MRTLLTMLAWSLSCVVASAQFKDSADAGADWQLGRGQAVRIRVGVIVKASGGAIQRILATAPVPAEWPEQEVRIVREEFSPAVSSVTYREAEGGGVARQMVVEIPYLQANQEAKALVTFEVVRRAILAPSETSTYRVPKKLNRELTTDLGASPFIETRHVKVIAAAKEAVAGKTGDWQKAEAIYHWVREHVAHKTSELKGAARALADKEGDTDELVSLFVAMCRINKIPARTVFAPGHCHAEFYLEDAAGKGIWFPCQLNGAGSFGSIDDPRPILQKGDNFRDPENPQVRVRFVTEHFRASGRGGEPQVQFVSELIAE